MILGYTATRKNFSGNKQHMIARMLKLIGVLTFAVVLSACDQQPVLGKNGNFRLKDAGPDEFAVLPTKELAFPEDYTTLPEPVLGGVSRADVTPQRDAIAALGGKPAQLDNKQINRNEQSLVTAASRFGVSPDIRATLSEEDKEFRHKNRARFYEKWFYTDNGYLRRRKADSLDSYNELTRLRRLGVRTPSVPPQSTQ